MNLRNCVKIVFRGDLLNPIQCIQRWALLLLRLFVFFFFVNYSLSVK